MDFAETLQYLRKLHNLTQEELGQQIGVTGSNVNRYEKGLSFPKLPTVVKLAKIFNVSLDSLVNIETETNRQAGKLKQYQAILAPNALVRYDEVKRIYNVYIKTFLSKDEYQIDKSGKLYDGKGFQIPDEYINKEDFDCVPVDEFLMDELIRNAKNTQKYFKAEMEKVYNQAVASQFLILLGQTAGKMVKDEKCAFETMKKIMLDHLTPQR